MIPTIREVAELYCREVHFLNLWSNAVSHGGRCTSKGGGEGGIPEGKVASSTQLNDNGGSNYEK
jgi:hypothetical protein